MSVAPYAFMAACGLPWVIAGWYRIRRYMRYFQLEGYERKRYINWLWHNPVEGRFFGQSLVIAMPILAIGFVCGFFLVGASFILGTVNPAVVILLLSIGFGLLALFRAPRDMAAKQKFTLTPRATRLLVTAFVVEMIPFLLAAIIGGSIINRAAALSAGSTSSSQPVTFEDMTSSNPTQQVSLVALSSALIFAVSCFIAAPITHFMTPFVPLTADILNWPIEESFRRYYLRRAKRFLKRSGATVIAITGSYGKTSTKHYLNHILNGRFRVLMTPKSYNTLLGISRVINDVLANDVSYEYFIVETDAYFVGENARICKLVEPQMGMVMTVGPMHLERLGSMENIATAQYEVIQALPPNGVGFFNGDDPAVSEMAGRGYPQTTVMVSKTGVSGARLEALNVLMTAEGLDFDVRDNQTGEQRAMHAPLYGDHNVTNILMAAAVARVLGMSLAEIGMRVTTLEPAEHRLIRRVMADGIVLIDDTYSANPVGTQTALGVLALQKDSPHRVVVSSGMFELGAASDKENRKLGERMAAASTDVILIGAAQTRSVKEGLESASFPPDHLHVVNTLGEAVEVYRQILRPGDALLMLTDLPDLYAAT